MNSSQIFLNRKGSFKAINIPTYQRVLTYSEDELTIARFSSGFEIISYYSLNVLTNETKELSSEQVTYRCGQLSFCMDSRAEILGYIKTAPTRIGYYVMQKDAIPLFSYLLGDNEGFEYEEPSSLKTGTVLQVAPEFKVYIPENGYR